MISGEGNQNGENTAIGLISKKATLFVQHTFFVHFFTVVLHDYNVKLPETSWLVTRFMEEIRYVFLFTFCSLLLILTSVAGSISHFLTAATKSSCCSSKKKCILCFLSHSLALCRSQFSRWASQACRLLSLFLCLSLYIYSKFVYIAINLTTPQVTKL